MGEGKRVGETGDGVMGDGGVKLKRMGARLFHNGKTSKS